MPGTWLNFMRNELFLGLGWPVLLAGAAGRYKFLNLFVDPVPEDGFFGSQLAFLHAEMAIVKLVEHLLLHGFGYDQFFPYEKESVFYRQLITVIPVWFNYCWTLRTCVGPSGRDCFSEKM